MPKREELNIDDYQKFVLEYHGESDRSAIVLAGSFCEHYLATYLREFMIDDEEVEKLFNRSLQSFDARIDIAYAFNLIPKKYRDDLKLVKDIRNFFAHTPRAVTIDHPTVKALIRKMSMYAMLHAEDVPDRVQRADRDIYLYTVGMFVASSHSWVADRKKRQGIMQPEQ